MESTWSSARPSLTTVGVPATIAASIMKTNLERLLIPEAERLRRVKTAADQLARLSGETASAPRQ